MKKLFIKLTAIILSIITVISMCACDKTPDEQTEKGNFVKDGKSDYKLVLPQNYHGNEYFAASEFNTMLKLSTGTELEIVYDNAVEYTSKDKFISLGQTKFLNQLGVKPDYSDLLVQGFVIKKIDNCVVIAGATRDGFGTMYGVYEFLARQIDYECYAEDEIYVREATNLDLVDVDITDKPDVALAVRCGGCYESNKEFQNRHRFVAHYDIFKGNMSMYHSSFTFLPPAKYSTTHPKWYATSGNQICYTARGDEAEFTAMVEELFEVFKAEIEKTPEINHIGFSIMDNIDFCKCETCTEQALYFGNSNAALIVRFLNKLSDRFAQYYQEKGEEKELNFMFFSYKATFNPPTEHIEEATCNENVYPFICTFEASRTASFTDWENQAIRTAIEGWEKVCSKMAFWTYSANYNNYLFPHNPFNCLQDNLQYIKSKNPVYYKNEGVGDNYNMTGFVQLKYYLESKLAWDTTLNMEELIQDYFVHYFKDASDIMYEFFMTYRLALARMYNEYWRDHYDNSTFEARNISFGVFKMWQGYIEEAYDAIEYLKEADRETYDKLYKRIALESIMVDYNIIYLYGSKMSEHEKQALKEKLIYHCELTNLVWADDYGSRAVDVITNLP